MLRASGQLPSAAELSRLPRGVGMVEVTGCVDFDADPPAGTMPFVRFLRDAAAFGVDVRWTGRCADVTVGRRLTHLPPPCAPLSAGTEAEWRQWQGSYRLGLLYRRKGPGFVLVYDRRPHRGDSARIVIGDARLCAALEACQEPVDFAAAGIEKAVRHLAATGLVLLLGDRAITLPYRLPAWPVPAYSV